VARLKTEVLFRLLNLPNHIQEIIILYFELDREDMDQSDLRLMSSNHRDYNPLGKGML
jgi:hypothetical protein